MTSAPYGTVSGSTALFGALLGTATGTRTVAGAIATNFGPLVATIVEQFSVAAKLGAVATFAPADTDATFAPAAAAVTFKPATTVRTFNA